MAVRNKFGDALTPLGAILGAACSPEVINRLVAIMEKRPPNDRNQGRKPIKEGQATVCMTIRLTAGQREKLAQFGGAKWIREKIDKATTVRFKDTRT